MNQFVLLVASPVVLGVAWSDFPKNLWCLLLPFLLGGLLGWALKWLLGGRNHEKLEAEWQGKLRDSDSRFTSLNADLSTKSKLADSLSADLTASQGKLKTIDADFKKASGELLVLRGEFDKEKTSRLSLDKELADLKLRIGTLSGDLNACQSARATLEASLKTRDSELADLRGRWTILSKEAEQAKGEGTNLAAEIAKLTAAAGATALAMKAVEGDKSKFTDDINRLRAQLVTTTEAKASREQDLQELLGGLHADVRTATGHKSENEVRLKGLETDKARLTDDLSIVRNQLVTTTEAKAGREQDLGELVTKLHGDVRGSHSSAASKDSEIHDLKQKLQGREGDLQSTKTGLSGEIAKLTAAAGVAAVTLKALESDKAGLSQSVKAAQDRGAKLDADLAQARRDLEASNQNKAKVQQELDAVRAKIAAADAETARLRKDLSDLQGHHGKLKGEHETLAKARTDLESRLKAKEAEAGEHRQKHDAIAATHRTLATEHEGLKSKHGQLQKSHDDLQAQIQARTTEITGIRTKISGLETELATHRRRNDESEGRLKQREAELVSLRTNLTGLESEKTRLASELAKEPPVVRTVSACPQNLSDVQGIGTVYEDRLYAHGIGTFWELSKVSDADLIRILELSEQQKASFDFKGIRAHALRLANETHSRGRTWSGQAPDNLEPLAGIGPVYEGKLYSAGICTYEALCKATPELLAEIIQAPEHLKPDYAKWIEQGCKLSRLKASRPPKRDENDESPFLTSCPQHLSDVKGIGTVFETRLYANGVGTYWELSRLTNAEFNRYLDLDEKQQQRFSYDETRADALRLAKETKSKGRVWAKKAPDDLEPIHGIGYTFEKRLYDAGLCTYESICEATPEILDEISQAPKHNKPDYASWITQACAMAKNRPAVAKASGKPQRDPNDETPYKTSCPQHLSDVKGIGTVYEGRLYAGGVGTYWELSKLKNEDFVRLLELDERQREQFDYESTRSDALKLAGDTRSKGRAWSATPPDDLEPIHGIGYTFEKRLYDAGLCTYEAIASASPELLDEVVEAPPFNKPDYASWIAQARDLASKKKK